MYVIFYVFRVIDSPWLTKTARSHIYNTLKRIEYMAYGAWNIAPNCEH